VTHTRSATPPAQDEHLQAALPALRAIDERLAQVLLPSITVPTPTVLADSFWQIAKALHFMLEALDASTGSGQASHLGGAGEALESAAGDLRQARADLMHLQDLAAEELEQQMASVDLESDAIANTADLEVSVPNGQPARIQISIDASTGRAAWSSPDVDLAPIGGRRQLDLTAGLRMLAETITGALPASAFDQTGN
jgi:hypothetical protein